MYALDHAAIQAAADFLELRHPVHVQIDGSFGLKLGQYVGLRRRGHRARWSTPDWPERRHVIVLARGMNADTASATLWHELAHALQCEHDWDGDHAAFFRDYNRLMREARALSVGVRSRRGHDRYKAVHYEAEADEYGALGETDPLTRPAR